jgi:hypothetical protein
MSLGERLADVSPRGPVWKGPEVDGITQSLLSSFLVCRERFRIRVIEGLRVREGFSHRMEFGNMWHACEEAIALGSEWQSHLFRYTIFLGKQYPLQADQVEHWYNVVRRQFPLYLKHWDKRHEPPKTRLLSEQVFDVPYHLPSGRKVRLRGKWDSVDYMPEHTDEFGTWPAGIWLQENKTKGEIEPSQIARQLSFDLQTMFYLVSLQAEMNRELGPDGCVYGPEEFNDRPIVGVRYNVVRRPLSGGKYSYRQGKHESSKEYYGRLEQAIKDDPSHFFMRWSVAITQSDIDRFRKECLDTLLEQLYNWWTWVSLCNGSGNDPFSATIEYPGHGTLHNDGVHWRMPYGIYNPLLEGRSTELDFYLATGSTVGLEQVSNLFPELSMEEK